MDVLLEAQLLVQVGPDAYQLSDLAFSALVHCRDVDGYANALEPDDTYSYQDQTHWELFCKLVSSGWALAPSKGRAAPISLTTLPPADGDRVVYFSGRTLDVSHPYLEVLLTLEDVKSRGPHG